jgi:hypothetical protein
MSTLSKTHYTYNTSITKESNKKAMSKKKDKAPTPVEPVIGQQSLETQIAVLSVKVESLEKKIDSNQVWNIASFGTIVALLLGVLGKLLFL